MIKHTRLSLAALCAACLLAASCHPNRPDAPATQHVYLGKSHNNTYGFTADCQIILNTYKGHNYIDGEWRAYGSSRLLHDGQSYDIEGYRKGTRVCFVNVPSALNRGMASAFGSGKPENAVDSIYRTNRNMGATASKFTGTMTDSTLSGTWVSEVSATDRQNNPGVATTQRGTFSLKRP